MATFKDLYDHVLPSVRGVDSPLVDYHIRRVLRDFLKKTTVWRETLPLLLTAGKTDYRLTPAASGQVGGVLRVYNRATGLPLHNRDEGCVVNGVVDAGAPDQWWQVYPSLISFNRPPSESQQLDVEAYKVVTLDPADDYFPDDVYENFVEIISNGVMSALQMMPAKPWTDTTMATVNNALYKKATYALRAKIRGGGAGNHSRVQAPRFAGRR